MARLLVAGSTHGIAQRGLLRRIVERLRADGQDAFLFGRQDEDPADAVKDCDAVVALLDGCDPGTACAIAFAAAHDKPVLGYTSGEVHPLLADLAQVHVTSTEDALWSPLPAFYEKVRPFAGRVVRDRIPQLVKEAGHDVRFRELPDAEKPRFLKQKVATEAKELLKADVGKEKEEVADVLEALEAFIRARGFPRDDLRRVKEAKRKRRGGFDKVYVVESTATDEEAEENAPAEDVPSPPADPEAPLAADQDITSEFREL